MTGIAWDREVDLVVIGFGAAGAAASLRGVQLGLDVLLLEKQRPDAHTPSASMSGGSIMVTTDSAQAANYLDKCADGMVPYEVSAAWAAKAGEIAGWLTSTTGASLARRSGAEHPEFPGADAVHAVTAARDGVLIDAREGRGSTLFRGLREAVLRSEVKVWFDSVTHRLITMDGRVQGVEVSRAGGPAERVAARRGVVLAMGGIEFDNSSKSTYLPEPLYFYGNRGNTGDGMRLIESLDVDLWHMDQFIGRGVGSFEHEALGRLNFIIFTDPPGYVLTDRHGQRFADESEQAAMRHDFYRYLLDFDGLPADNPRLPVYWFFDESRRLAGPLSNPGFGMAIAGIYRWSDDNMAEIERGWIKLGDTIAEAAAAAGVEDPEQAAATVEAYNQICAAGVDPEFNRPPETLVPLSTPPYYCVPLWPGGSHTTGGPRRDQHARILNRSGEPIPGLYGAGEFGQAVGRLFASNGASWSDALSFGCLAAEHAAGL